MISPILRYVGHVLYHAKAVPIITITVYPVSMEDSNIKVQFPQKNICACKSVLWVITKIAKKIYVLLARIHCVTLVMKTNVYSVSLTFIFTKESVMQVVQSKLSTFTLIRTVEIA